MGLIRLEPEERYRILKVTCRGFNMIDIGYHHFYTRINVGLKSLDTSRFINYFFVFLLQNQQGRCLVRITQPLSMVIYWNLGEDRYTN